MYTKQMVFAISIAISLMIYLVGGISLFPSQQTTAQTSNPGNNTLATISTEEIVNATSPGQAVVLRGIVSSEDFKGAILKPGDESHGAPILPNRPDGTAYVGTVTYSATKPVEVGISHRLHIDNATYSNINQEAFGELYSSYHHGKGETGTPGELSVPSVIVPDYGTAAPPYFSASIPFVGDSVWLRTPHGEPFVAVYEIYAEIVQPMGVVDLDTSTRNAITNSTSISPSS